MRQRDRSRSGGELPLGQTSVFDDQPLSCLNASLLMHGNKCLDFGIDLGLQHSPGPLANKFIKRTFLVTLSSKPNLNGSKMSFER